jgi:hypothetical protein
VRFFSRLLTYFAIFGIGAGLFEGNWAIAGASVCLLVFLIYGTIRNL